jgi:hypothetical protein
MTKGAFYYSIETKNLYQSNFIMCHFYFIFTSKDKIKLKWMTWKINKLSYIFFVNERLTLEMKYSRYH